MIENCHLFLFSKSKLKLCCWGGVFRLGLQLNKTNSSTYIYMYRQWVNSMNSHRVQRKSTCREKCPEITNKIIGSDSSMWEAVRSFWRFLRFWHNHEWQSSKAALRWSMVIMVMCWLADWVEAGSKTAVFRRGSVSLTRLLRGIS